MKTKKKKHELPTVWFDVETTGLNPITDRIVQLAMVKLYGGKVKELNIYFNPEKECSKEAYEVHGLSNAFLRTKSVFKERIKEIKSFIFCKGKQCNFGGYNAGFDLLFLKEELSRVGIDFDISKSKIFDPLLIWRKYEPRTLASAYKRFTGNEMTEYAHNAIYDIKSTIDVFTAMRNLFNITVSVLSELTTEFTNHFKFADGEKIINKNNTFYIGYNKYKDKPMTINWIYNNDYNYMDWLIEKSSISTIHKYYLQKYRDTLNEIKSVSINKMNLYNTKEIEVEKFKADRNFYLKYK